MDEKIKELEHRIDMLYIYLTIITLVLLSLIALLALE